MDFAVVRTSTKTFRTNNRNVVVNCFNWFGLLLPNDALAGTAARLKRKLIDTENTFVEFYLHNRINSILFRYLSYYYVILSFLLFFFSTYVLSRLWWIKIYSKNSWLDTLRGILERHIRPNEGRSSRTGRGRRWLIIMIEPQQRSPPQRLIGWASYYFALLYITCAYHDKPV
jgi:hypothetical protein